jgi:class 3 adenylate cyclase/predicted ATPase
MTVPRTASLASATISPAERRQLTIMFCDMVGSSSLSTRLDPEEQREVVGAFQAYCAGEVKRLGGMVAQYLGDGVLAYFGYPAAHEDDAERAVRAGLSILAGVGDLRSAPGVTLQARIGVATGLVVVGDLVREGVTQEKAAVGETTNLAARLQSLAEPNTLLICPETHRLVGALFDYRDLGRQTLKGFANPMHVRLVTGASRVENRFEARRADLAAPLLGRDEELDLLARRWQQAKAGEGRVVLIAGEPGIGKSRLTRALLERLQAEPHTRLQYHCSPYHQDSALYPIISQLLRAAGIEQEDARDTKLGKLKAALAQTSRDHDETVALLAPLLSIPLGPGSAPPDLSPQRRKELTFRALADQLEALAARQPVLMIVEDAHWIDPTSLEFFSRIIERIANLPVLLVITARPEFVAPWPSHTHVSTLTLNRLGRQEGEALILSITEGKALPAEVFNQIIARTDGVPLFVEELTKTVLESGLLDDAGERYVLRGPLPALAIPSTLHASLLARLDRLAAVKDVAQTAAVIGREFSYALISAVAGLPEQDLQAALAQLVAAELVFQRGLPPDAKYLFKHALVQDAAYASLVRSRRQQLHAQIARALEDQFPDIVESEPAVLAQHFTAASLTERGVFYWHKAGQQASDRSAYLEGTKHFTTGIELLKTLPDTPERAQQELALHIALGAALIVIRGHASTEVEKAYLKAHELCQRIGATAELIPVLFGLWRCYISRPQLRRALELGESLQRLALKADDAALGVIANYAVGVSRDFLGELAEARRALEDGIAQYAPQMRQAPLFRIAQDPGVACRSYLARCLWLLGFPDQALTRGRDGLTLALELKHPFSVTFARCWLAYVAQFRRDVAAVHEHADAALALATEQGFPIWTGMATALRGWALAAEGKGEEGLVQIQKGIAAWQAVGAGVWRPSYCTMLAEAFDLLGKIEHALQILDEAEYVTESTEERWWEAEIYRLRANLLLRHSMTPQPEAEGMLRRALEVARRQQGKSLELRAATSLARLWFDQGRHAEASDLLAPVYGWFTEGFDTLDLKEARALLEEVSCTAPRPR